jgi:serine/threonine protein kinase
MFDLYTCSPWNTVDPKQAAKRRAARDEFAALLAELFNYSHHPNMPLICGAIMGDPPVRPVLCVISYLPALPSGSPPTVTSLAKLLGNGTLASLSGEDKIKIAQGIWEAVACVHNQGYPHGHLTPENVLLQPDYTPLVCRLQNRQVEKSKIARQSQIGSVEYTAPEDFDEVIGDCRPVDVWAFGLLLFDLVYGSSLMTALYGPRGIPVAKWMLLVIKDTLGKRVLPLLQGCSKPLSELILRCLQVKPGDRPMAAEVLGSLKMLTPEDFVRTSPLRS